MTTDPKSASPRTDQFSSNIERQIQSGNTRYDEMVLFARHLERELADCKAELALERECREVGKAPCGHSEQYCYTADEGKHIACLLCEHESHLAAHTEREGVTVPANIFQGALNYIRHVGANWTERGEKHPQQWIVDGLELAAANQPAPSAASGLAEIRTTTGMMLPLERYNELLEAEQFRAAMLHKDVTRERPYVCRECGNWELVKRCTRRDQPWVSVNPQWRCHKFEDHAGACSTHMDCGERSSEGTICGYTPDHEGPHAWEALHSHQAPVGEDFDILKHLARQREWSERTFGPGARTAGVIDHIRKELKEIEGAPDDVSEWIDVTILALDGAWRAGYSPEQIVAAIQAKQAKNEARKWPDWHTSPPDKAIEHDRTPSPQTGDES